MKKIYKCATMFLCISFLLTLTACGGQKISMTIKNMTGYTISELRIASMTDKEWGKNLLKTDIEDCESADVTIGSFSKKEIDSTFAIKIYDDNFDSIGEVDWLAFENGSTMTLFMDDGVLNASFTGASDSEDYIDISGIWTDEDSEEYLTISPDGNWEFTDTVISENETGHLYYDSNCKLQAYRDSDGEIFSVILDEDGDMDIDFAGSYLYKGGKNDDNTDVSDNKNDAFPFLTGNWYEGGNLCGSFYTFYSDGTWSYFVSGGGGPSGQLMDSGYVNLDNTFGSLYHIISENNGNIGVFNLYDSDRAFFEHDDISQELIKME